jgi:hypothetical protein
LDQTRVRRALGTSKEKAKPAGLSSNLSTSKSTDSQEASCCRWEFKVAHEEWLTKVNPDLAPDVAARVRAALSTSEERANLAVQVRQELRAAMDALLKVSVKRVRLSWLCTE